MDKLVTLVSCTTGKVYTKAKYMPPAIKTTERRNEKSAKKRITKRKKAPALKRNTLEQRIKAQCKAVLAPDNYGTAQRPYKLGDIDLFMIRMMSYAFGYTNHCIQTNAGIPKPINLTRIRDTLKSFEQRIIPLYLQIGWRYAKQNIQPEFKAELMLTINTTCSQLIRLLEILDQMKKASDCGEGTEVCCKLYEILCNHLLYMATVYEKRLGPKTNLPGQAMRIKDAAIKGLNLIEKYKTSFGEF